MKIGICIITCNRPKGLEMLLQSLQSQKCASLPGWDFTLYVVDNSADDTGTRKIVEGVAAGYKNYPMLVGHEPEPGIPFAREKSVKMAWNDDALIFVDDDEIAPEGWLEKICTYWQKTGADVVTGPVVGRLPDDAPVWARNSGLFDSMNRHKTGTMLKKAYTNNTLVAQKVYHTVTPGFHAAFRYTGSSDTHFFMKAYEAGFKIIWNNEIFIYEDVPLSRTKIGWHLKRGFRSGSGDTKCRLLIRPGLRTVGEVLVYGLGRTGYGVICLIKELFSAQKGRIIGQLRRIMAGIGTFAGLFNINYDEYKTQR